MNQLDNWPRVIQLAWLTTDLDGAELNRREILIKPDGWTIPSEETHGKKAAAFWIEHGFTTETNERDGTPMGQALAEFVADLNRSEYLVSHNMDFDHKVLGAEMLRENVTGKKLLKICTKEASTQWCKIPFDGQRAWLSKHQQRFKWPKLEELHLKLFGCDFENKHQAGGDVAALAKCFFELVRINVIQLEPEHQAKIFNQ